MLGLIRRHRQRLHRVSRIGERSIIHELATLNFHERLAIGSFVRIGAHCHLDAEGGIEIGDGSIFAPRVVVLSSSHYYQQEEFLPYDARDDMRPVSIGRGVWIGWGAMIAPGTTIGDGAVVAMGSVVTGQVGSGSIVAGNPARCVRERPAGVVERLVAEGRYFLKAVAYEGLKREHRTPRRSG